MIQINFPPDPSNLIFTLEPNNIISAYLLLRAVKHYGADNLIVFNGASINHPGKLINPQMSYRESRCNRVADILGLPQVRIPQLNINLNTTTDVEHVRKLFDLRPAAVEALEQYIGTIPHVDQLNTKYVIYMYALYTAATQISDRGDFKLVTSHTLSNENFNGLSNHRYNSGVLSLTWSPLAEYTVVDILKSAHEEGLIDQLSNTINCKINHKSPCGVCTECMVWKMQLIEAEVV